MKSNDHNLSYEEVCDLLAECIAKKSLTAATPAEGDVVELTYWLSKYRIRPWTEKDVTAYRKANTQARQDRQHGRL